LKQGSLDYFSSGQRQDESFKVNIWDENGNFVTWFDEVYYRDTIYVSREPKVMGRPPTMKDPLVIVYGHGGFSSGEPGKVERFTFPEEDK